MAPISHIVLIHFKPETSKETISEMCDKMLGLKEKCVTKDAHQTYIKNSYGGIDNSVEGRQGGMTHAFIVEFENEADRDYYALEDPAHLQFVQELVPHVVNAQVVDFTPGKF